MLLGVILKAGVNFFAVRNFCEIYSKMDQPDKVNQSGNGGVNVQSSRPLNPVSGWGQSEGFRMISSGWGQGPTPSYTNLESASFISAEPHASYASSSENYSGPIETWSNYKAVTNEEWELFKEHMVVYSDGKNADGIEPGWLTCTLCTGKKAQSKDLMHAHIESMKHRRNYSWLKMEQSRGVDDPNSASPIQYNPYTLPALSEEDTEILKRHRCEVVDGWIMCTLCHKKMMDMSFVPEHIRTTKHLNNIEWVNSQEGMRGRSMEVLSDLPEGVVMRDWDYYCNLCGASMTSKTIVAMHAASSRHQRQVPSKTVERQTWTSEPTVRVGVTIANLIDLPSSSKETAPSKPPPLESLTPRIPDILPSRPTSAMTAPRRPPPVLEGRAPSPPRDRPRPPKVVSQFTDLIDI